MLLVPEVIDSYKLELRRALEANEPEVAVPFAEKLSSARVARELKEAPEEAVLPFLLALDATRAGKVIAQLPSDLAADILLAAPDEDRGRLFSRVPADHAADILELLSDELTDELLALTEERLRDELKTLVKYPHGSAGGVMMPRYVAIPEGSTVGMTLDALVSAPPEVERAAYVFVLDQERRLTGVISLRDLMRADPKTVIDEVMNRNVVASRATDSAHDAARLLRHRRLMLLPVVDDSGVLLGVLTFDDAMDIVAEQVAAQFAGVGGGSGEESFFTPPLEAVRGRLPWMAANIFLNLGAVAIITGFEDTIAQVAILAAFLPMITDMGGNVGIQSLSVAIRSLALGEVRVRDFWHATKKELVIGLVNGLVLGVLFAVVAWVLRGNAYLGALAGLALGINVLVAGVVGGSLPFLIKRLGKDPAMMTGPVLTTVTDITGVTIYLGLCTVFMSSLIS